MEDNVGDRGGADEEEKAMQVDSDDD